MSEKDGGAAFPTVSTGYLKDTQFPSTKRLSLESAGGLSLRDYFAAQSLIGILANPHLVIAKPAPELAMNCYEIADAMLKERAK